ncbi:MAG: hypothetical protein LAQ30_04465 [Acidobacteriia bacterium]|nr:hypothetical protein [Terriglobia bacterium]
MRRAFEARLAVALLSAPAWVSAAVRVSLPAWTDSPARNAVVSVTCLSQGGSASGVQFDLSYDSADLTVAAATGEAAARPGKSLYSAEAAPGLRRFLIVGTGPDSMPDGVLANLTVALKPDTRGESSALPLRPGRKAYRLEISNVIATDAQGHPVAIVGGNGSVIFRNKSPRSSAVTESGALNRAISPASDAADELLSIPAVSGTPSILTLYAGGPAIVLNHDATINTPANPAEKGSIVTLFMTGAAQGGRISVQIAGTDAEVVHAGATMAAGVVQINCVVPTDAPSGDAVPILIAEGDVRSPYSVTLAIR